MYDIGVPAVELVRGLSRSGRSRLPLRSWPAAARGCVAGTARMPPGSAALVLALAWRRLVGGVARWQGAARADRSARSPCLPRHTGVAGQASVAEKAGVAGRAGLARPRDLAGCLRFLG